jgi:ABC-type multidrug transport system ATPase subunit
MPTPLVVQNLVKRYPGPAGPVNAVDGLSFTVSAGEVYGLLGPNGAGKTTTLRCLATLASADEGTIVIHGIDRATSPLQAREHLAYVPAEAGLPERMTPREVVRLFAEIQGVKSPKDRAEVCLALLGATGFADTPCGDLSTGMKRRVVLARALVHDPPLLLLDEPTDGLDVSGRRDVLQVIRAQRDAGCGIVLSSHIMGEVEKVVDRVGVVANGRLVAEGTVAQVVAASGCTNLDDAFIALTGGSTPTDGSGAP